MTTYEIATEVDDDDIWPGYLQTLSIDGKKVINRLPAITPPSVFDLSDKLAIEILKRSHKIAQKFGLARLELKVETSVLSQEQYDTISRRWESSL